LRRDDLMGCSITAAPNQVEAKGDLGLVKGHAYSVTGATCVRLICLDKYIVFVPSVNPFVRGVVS